MSRELRALVAASSLSLALFAGDAADTDGQQHLQRLAVRRPLA